MFCLWPFAVYSSQILSELCVEKQRPPLWLSLIHILPSRYDQDIDDVYNLALKTINASSDGNVSVDKLLESMKDELLTKQPDLSE